MNETLSCRGCRHLLTSDAGCALCLGVKPHLVVSASVDEDSVPLATVASEAVSILRRQLIHLKGAIKLSPEYDYGQASEARAVATAIAKLLDSARKVVQDGAEAVGAMSFQERANLFMEWTSSLPGVYRRKIIENLLSQQDRKATEAESASPLIPSCEDGSNVVIH